MLKLNPRSWFRRGAGPGERKASSIASAIVPMNVGQAAWTPRDYEELTQESYVLNSIAFRCVKLIAMCAIVPDWTLVKRDGSTVETHPLIDLLNRPRPGMGSAAFFESIYTYLLLSGNSYIERVGPTGKPPKELWTHRPDRMKVVAGKFGLPQAYEYQFNGQTKRWPVDVRGNSQILHIHEFHPLNDWYGLSRIEPGAYGIDRHNASSAHNKALLDNGARPSGALVFEPIPTGADSVEMAPQSAIEAAEKELKERHGGPTNAGKPMVLGGKVDWKEMGVSPKDMDFDVGKQDAARDICNAIGVPPILIVRGEATYNNIREAKLELYEDTVLPLIDLVATEINHWLSPAFEDGLSLQPDLDSIPALEPRRESKRQSVTTLLDKGVLDADEAREELDYGPRNKNSVRTADGQLIKTLLDGADTFGMDPLVRYLKWVGLVDPSATEEQILAAAQRIMEDLDDDEDDDLLPLPNDDDEDEDED